MVLVEFAVIKSFLNANAVNNIENKMKNLNFYTIPLFVFDAGKEMLEINLD